MAKAKAAIASCGSDCSADWLHGGELSKEEAKQKLTAADIENGSFLFRHSQGELFLSVKYQQGVSHHKIVYGAGGYKLEGSEWLPFSELQDLVSHYRSNPMEDDVKLSTLGRDCAKCIKAVEGTCVS